VIAPEVAIVPETGAAATLSPVALPREEDGRWVLVLRLEQEAGSDLLGRSNLLEGGAQVSAGWPSVERIDRLGCIGCRRVPS